MQTVLKNYIINVQATLHHGRFTFKINDECIRNNMKAAYQMVCNTISVHVSDCTYCDAKCQKLSQYL